jgi:hypothetical protein
MIRNPLLSMKDLSEPEIAVPAELNWTELARPPGEAVPADEGE